MESRYFIFKHTDEPTGLETMIKIILYYACRAVSHRKTCNQFDECTRIWS